MSGTHLTVGISIADTGEPVNFWGVCKGHLWVFLYLSSLYPSGVGLGV
jgi:hypothetical protein